MGEKNNGHRRFYALMYNLYKRAIIIQLSGILSGKGWEEGTTDKQTTWENLTKQSSGRLKNKKKEEKNLLYSTSYSQC